MDNSEIEENLFSLGEPKLHGGMCKSLSLICGKVLNIFPDLEAARPRSTSGIQALCSLHIALEKMKTVLQHCAECSKLYLAITGDSIVKKFEWARLTLKESLRRVEEIVPQTIGSQISDILRELEGIEFSLDPLEKQIGDEIIELLQQGRNFNENNDNTELETFHQAASKLGITSSRSALKEKKALKKLIEKARIDEDEKKESIVAYLSHLINSYSKIISSDDHDSLGSPPCSPTVQESFGGTHQLSKMSSFNFKTNFQRSGQVPVPPEELKCPISLQLMYDPVIIESGQTYERICIEKWFKDGHNTCPKSQQELTHLNLTPNYCVKGLVASWCEQNSVSVPEGPPDSLDLNYWRLALSESESKLPESVGSGEHKGGSKVVSMNEAVEGNSGSKRYANFLTVLDSNEDLSNKCGVVEEIRSLLKDNTEARSYMGVNGFVEVLLRFLQTAVKEKNKEAQVSGAMALFNLAVNNNRNKELMLAAGVLPLLHEMSANSKSQGATTALYLNLSCLQQAKPIIGSTQAIPFLIQTLRTTMDPQCKLDALLTLYNLSVCHSNIPRLVSFNIIDALHPLITDPNNKGWAEKAIAVLINLALTGAARDAIVSSHGLVNGLTSALDSGEPEVSPEVQEQAAACLLILCTGSEKCSQMVLQEGVIPSLVLLSVNGTSRGKQKAQKLLMLFREQRQRDPRAVQLGRPPQCESSEKGSGAGMGIVEEEPKPLSKSSSRRKVGRAWSLWWKNKSYSVHHC